MACVLPIARRSMTRFPHGRARGRGEIEIFADICGRFRSSKTMVACFMLLLFLVCSSMGQRTERRIF